ncbi:MAG: LamG domain-containing protein [Gammaproteobacteria bacterium]|nr:LamG domain-containing protein [Gammaproteobacteria bacterium]
MGRNGGFHSIPWLFLAAMIAFLSGCGGGATTETLPAPRGSATVGIVYSGPAPSTSDVQRFKLNVWDHLADSNRCGACHGQDGPASPAFVRTDDINAAYAAVNPLVDLTSPADSRLVAKVAGGHNCWLEADSACGALLTTYIEGWANAADGGAGRQITLQAPVDITPGKSKSFPADPSVFGSTVHPLLVAHCSGCHIESSSTPQAPFFAAADVNAAYDAVKAKIDLDTPSNSRLVIRLRSEFHNCWSGDCQNDANVMEAAIQSFSAQAPVTDVDPSLVISKALKLTEGVVASGGSRIEDNVVALYEFKTGQGNIAYDTSGVEPDLHLNLSGNVSWVGGWGIEIIDGKAQGSTTASKKLHELITATGEYSIEAWVVPANVTQEGPARIISYSAGTQARNFTLGQTRYNYDFLHRSSTTNANGDPALSTADAAERLKATQQHVVVTFDPANGRRIYVNGEFTGDLDTVAGGNLSGWDDTFALVLGNEASGDRLWQGKLRLVAIHNRALTQAQIQQNFKAGVGEKFFLLFNVSDLISVPQSYIMFEVSQFDSYSYLFDKPTFVNLDPNAVIPGIVLQGMRIGINGKEALVGQAYTNLNTSIGGSAYVSSGQLLSSTGTVIALEKGPDADEFFLTFETLGSHMHVVSEPALLTTPPPADSPAKSDIGLRTFEEIHASMAAVTDVRQRQSDVNNVFTSIKQQLPTVENIDGFLAAHQMAISQLAIEYCSALMDGKGQQTPDTYFPGFDFAASADTAFDQTVKRDLLIDPLLKRMVGVNIASQADPALVKTELNALIDRLTACAVGTGATCATTARTVEVAKATCAATLGSAVVLLQ